MQQEPSKWAGGGINVSGEAPFEIRGFSLANAAALLHRRGWWPVRDRVRVRHPYRPHRARPEGTILQSTKYNNGTVDRQQYDACTLIRY